MIKHLFILFGLWFIISCASPAEQNDEYDSSTSKLPDLNLVNGVEIVTWNIEFFPKAGQRTIDSVAMIIRNINADIYCLQEITNETVFNQLDEKLDNYSSIYSTATEYLNLAILYKNDVMTFRNQSSILTDYSYEFASRPPLRAEFIFTADTSIEFTLINIHLKCCDDGFTRRKASAELLHDYISESMTNGVINQIVVGDWNDDISDNSSVNSFNMFLSDTDNFKFMTWDLANSTSNVYDSYPSYSSFIDHILVSQDLFDEAETGDVQTIRLGDYISGYDEIISDHRPVVWRFTP
jgi:exonuclease III|tara:strand:+ start:13882 stop:14766 length:885 start_codon:yes stop_codon:yes gene_type:complete